MNDQEVYSETLFGKLLIVFVFNRHSSTIGFEMEASQEKV